jgi:hypothetical protein
MFKDEPFENTEITIQKNAETYHSKRFIIQENTEIICQEIAEMNRSEMNPTKCRDTQSQEGTKIRDKS